MRNRHPMQAQNGNILVFDAGGTHISAALIANDRLALHSVRSVQLDGHGTKQDILNAIERVGRDVLSEAGLGPISGTSLAVPGPFDYENGIGRGQHKYEALFGVSLRTEVAARFAIAPDEILFLNDAAAFLLGEIQCGPAATSSRVIGITLGTGIGSAFAENGRIVTSGCGVPNGGEIWNLPFEGSIVEDAISARAIERFYAECTGMHCEVRDIAERVPDDPAASQVFRQVGVNLGKVLYPLCCAFRADTIVCGGAISRSSQWFLPELKLGLRGLGVRVRCSRLFERAALVGAGAYWFNAKQRSLDVAAQ